MDIQGTASAAGQVAQSAGRSGSESAVNERRESQDSEIERKEIEPSDTGSGVGERVDIQA
ncbi:hypothetical protein GCM10017044_23840 [Kordiimonas sediminis]|uniref:Uncharacterized protein n=1 Tax=Kordiimonas sediminis TaxID=1735581 RepID=A0A919AVA0_9PROT|nr:hypothetical protein [Kordiimonas sediminis]GHF27907.1 hypothetical protein GCM10017044_23840 [Kordiimonas sediminis]